MSAWAWRGVGLSGLVGLVASAFAFDRLVAFGDSLTDAGNVYDLSGGLLPAAPYWHGRFSNGPVWVERLGDRLGLPAVRSRAGGDVFAYGGAGAGAGFSYGVVPNVGTQVAEYLVRETPTPGTLFALWAGGNDYNGGERDEATPTGHLLSWMHILASRGARSFLVPNLPFLGEVPGITDPTERTELNAVTLRHNARLHREIARFRMARPEVSVYELDVFGFFGEVRANPAAFGFANVTTAAIEEDPATWDGYLFWDAIHPTRVAHGLIAQRAAALVPEPSSWLALVAGALALACRRSNRIG